MYQPAMILGQSTDELVYIIAVLIIIGVGWVSERVKAKMAEREQGDRQRRPGTRKHPTSMPRPRIPLEEPPEKSGRPAVPPTIPRSERPPMRQPARPPARPPTAAPARPQARPAQRPPAPARRTIEERRAVIRGEEPPKPRPAAPTPPPQPVAEVETWAKLAQWGEQAAVTGKTQTLGTLRPAISEEEVRRRRQTGARSFRHLSVAELQRALVLKEILEPPLAMRES